MESSLPGDDHLGDFPGLRDPFEFCRERPFFISGVPFSFPAVVLIAGEGREVFTPNAPIVESLLRGTSTPYLLGEFVDEVHEVCAYA